MADQRYSLRRRQKRPLVDSHPLDGHFESQEEQTAEKPVKRKVQDAAKSQDTTKSPVCKKCGRRFGHAHLLERHAQLCSAKRSRGQFGSYPCQKCNKVFQRSDWLRRHQEVHSAERPYKCTQCPAAYKRRDALQRHELVQHTWAEEQVKKSTADEARCVKCGKVYMAGEITKHMAMSHFPSAEQPQQQEPDSHKEQDTKAANVAMNGEKAERLGVDSQDDEQTPEKSSANLVTGTEQNTTEQGTNLEDKVNVIEPVMPVETRPHDQGLPQLAEVEQNGDDKVLEEKTSTTGHAEETEEVTEDLGTFEPVGLSGLGENNGVVKSEDDKLQHDVVANGITSESANDKHHCNTCGGWLPSQKSLAIHEEEVHGVLSFICPECGQLYHKLHLLEQHLETHLGYRPHLCMVCKTSFTQEEDLRKHLEENHQFRELQRCVFCAQMFPTRFHMNAHIRLLHEARRAWCHQCRKPVSPFHSLAGHRKLVHGERKLRCEECGGMFKSMVSLTAHILRHRGTKSCLCDYCGNKFANQKELRGHVAKVHDPTLKKHVCDICGHKTWGVSALWDHKYRLHPDQISEDEKRKSCIYRKQQNLIPKPDQHYSCDKCGKKYQSMLKLQRHAALHEGRAHTCTVCGYKFLKESDLRRHVAVHTQTYACSICGKTFDTKKNRERHELVICRGEKEFRFTCGVCGKMIKYISAYAKHVAQHCSAAMTHTCPACHATFTAVTAFQGHIDAHVAKGETPWFCTVCNTYFEGRDRLAKHAKIHSDETPYLCTHCGRGFKTSQGLQIHENIHTRARDYACKECGRGFAQYSSMRRHELTHNKAQPHQCPLCDRRFSQKCSMDRHVRQHTGETPYVCDICGKGFKQSTLLHNHSKKVHQKLA